MVQSEAGEVIADSMQTPFGTTKFSRHQDAGYSMSRVVCGARHGVRSGLRRSASLLKTVGGGCS